MLPINSKTGKLWSHENANLVLQATKREVEDELNVLDEKRSGGRLNAANGWSPLVLIEGRYRADPELAGFKHTGHEAQVIMRGRFYKRYLANPCDEEGLTAELRKAQKDLTITVAIAEAEEMEAALRNGNGHCKLQPAPIDMTVDQSSANANVRTAAVRPRGRPVGSRNRPKLRPMEPVIPPMEAGNGDLS